MVKQKKKVPESNPNITRKNRTSVVLKKTKKNASLAEKQTKKKDRRTTAKAHRAFHYSSDEDNIEPGWRRVTVGGKAASKWCPLSKASQTYVNDLIQASASEVLSQVGNKRYDEVEDCMTSLKEQLRETVSTLVVPVTKNPYASLDSMMMSLNGELAKQEQNSQRLDKEILAMEKKHEETESKLARLESQHGRKSLSSSLLYPA